MNKKMYTIATYIRLSADDQNIGESNSVKHQRDLLSTYINKSPELSSAKVIEYVDDGYSGTTFNRPSMIKLLEQTKKGYINCIIVKDLSRLGRNYLEMGNYLEQIFPFLGVRVIAINDDYDSDKNVGTTTGIEIPFKNLINDLYAKDISKKVKSAHQALKRQGKFISAYAFYGYFKDKKDKHKLIIDPVASKVVKRIYKLYLEGTGMTDIARILNDENVLTPLQYKKSMGSSYGSCTINSDSVEKMFWKRDYIDRILKEERYTGKLISNRRGVTKVGSAKCEYKKKEDWIIIEDTHKPIISQVDFDKVMELRKDRYLVKSKQSNIRKQHVLSNVRCGGCNSKLHRTAKKRPKFFCINNWYSGENNCFHERIFIDELQGIVFELIKKHMEVLISYDELKKSSVQAKEDEKAKLEGSIKKHKEKIVKLKSDKMAMYEDYKMHQISKVEFIDRSDEINTRIAEIEKKTVELREIIEKELVYGESEEAKTAKVFYGANTLTKELYDTFVEGVMVYSVDRIEVRFRFGNEFFCVN
ncbi:MAG: recombinase family protein [Maledivibacter sp.]|jgi:DNA invertase Pin-like site-specific DNA recombinase|nr:recombinase family protein [Maledivibacter sp.]